MSIVRTLDTGSTGLIANDNAMSVIGNNLSNTNTAGFKAGQARFEDLLYQRLTGMYSPSDLGSGVRLAGISSDFGQGTLMETGNPLDMAIDGGGLFVLRDPALSQNFYTRAGQFGTDSDGYVINSWGQRLQGYGLDPLSGSAVGALSDIQIRNDLQDPKMTSVVKMNVNLDSKTQETIPNPQAFERAIEDALTGKSVRPLLNLMEPRLAQSLLNDLRNGNLTPDQLTARVISYFSSRYANYSTQVTVIDSQGEEHLVDVYFTKLMDSTRLDPTTGNPQSTGSRWLAWTAYNGTIPGGGSRRLVGNAYVLDFNRTGELTQQTSLVPGRYVFDDGSVNPQPISFDFGIQSEAWNNRRNQAGIPLDPNLGATTTRSAPSNVNAVWQDGLRAQHFMEFDMDQDGRLFGLNPDGSQTYLYQVALAEFTNPGGLQRAGKNNFVESNVSGTALIGKPNTGQRGSVIIRNVEQSNVDITEEFVNMIKIQRFYQANAETIRTADQMFQILTGLRR